MVAILVKLLDEIVSNVDMLGPLRAVCGADYVDTTAVVLVNYARRLLYIRYLTTRCRESGCLQHARAGVFQHNCQDCGIPPRGLRAFRVCARIRAAAAGARGHGGR